ncbi:SpoIIE family protein phosphatase [Streptomyces sp. NPDC058735]|uniref:SpoIIE family protein phosphatase n=1 Tax=unclassified Streptomyces TaxID=2593676 RepID=UPI00368F2250
MPRVWDVPVRDATRVRDARVAAEEAAAMAGLDERRTAAAALVATELATNLLKHADGGQVLIDIVDAPALRPDRQQPRVVQITAIDHGPGMSDVRAAVRDGYSTTRSLGAGLGTCRRLADDFGLHSTAGRGTVAVARLGATPRSGDAIAPRDRAGTSVPASAQEAPPWSGSAARGGGARPGRAGPDGSPAEVPACGALTGHAAVGGDELGTARPPGGLAAPPAPVHRTGSRPASAPPFPDGAAARTPPPHDPPPTTGTAADQAVPAQNGPVPLAGVRAGGVNIPYGGAEYSGDAWTWVRAGDRVTLMLADGLGHGPEAARASSAAIAAVHRWAHLSPAAALGKLHDALQSTRGAAVAVAQLDLAAGLLRFAGIGNVGARLRTGGCWRPLLSRPGIVGVHRPSTLREEEADWGPDRLLILHTDGLPSRWTPPSDAGVPTADPAVTAAVTIRDASSPVLPVRDDTAVAVLTPTPPERP